VKEVVAGCVIDWKLWERKKRWPEGGDGCWLLVSKGEGDGGTIRVSKMKACAGKGVRLEEENQKTWGAAPLEKKIGLGLGFSSVFYQNCLPFA
jgi:hypothetical protein